MSMRIRVMEKQTKKKKEVLLSNSWEALRREWYEC